MSFNKGILFKNFTRGRLDWFDEEYILNNMSNAKHEFFRETAYNRENNEVLGLHEGMRRMMGGEKILLRGNVSFIPSMIISFSLYILSEWLIWEIIKSVFHR